MGVEEAFRIIALATINRAVEDATENDWERWPEIGEEDWDRISVLMRTLVEPWPENTEEALAILKGRAET